MSRSSSATRWGLAGVPAEDEDEDPLGPLFQHERSAEERHREREAGAAEFDRRRQARREDEAARAAEFDRRRRLREEDRRTAAERRTAAAQARDERRAARDDERASRRQDAERQALADERRATAGAITSAPRRAVAEAYRIASGHAGGTAAGTALGFLTLALGLNVLRYGPKGIVYWLKAKFLNEPVGSPQVGSPAAAPAPVPPGTLVV